MALPLRRLLFTAEQYHQLEEIGVLTEDDRVELIHGEIVEMAPVTAACARGDRFVTLTG